MKTQFLFHGFRSARACIGRVIIASTVAFAAHASVAQAQPVQITQQFELPPFSYVDLGYTQEQVDEAAANGLDFTDRPGLASGLQRLAGNHFISVSDRGPNFTVAAGRVFPLPAFTPSIFLLKTEAGSMVVEGVLPIVANDAGDPVTGIPNSATEDSIPLADATGTLLPFNPNGMDIEDIHTLPDGGYIVVEEYSPSVAIVNASGKVTRRYTPQGKTLAGASYPVSATLPAILSERRANRGFEGVALSTVVFSNEQTPEITDFKLEGLAILNPNLVAITNDNDFGIGDFPGAIARMWVIRLEDNLPTVPVQ